MKLKSLLLFSVILFSALIHSSCRTLKRHKSTTHTEVDSLACKDKFVTKETTTHEQSSKPLVINPGNMFGTFSEEALKKGSIIIENENYKTIITPPTDGKPGSVDVKGKNKTIDIPIDKTTHTKEISHEAESSLTQKHQGEVLKGKEVKGVSPLIQWAVGITALIFVLLLLASRFRK